MIVTAGLLSTTASAQLNSTLKTEQVREHGLTEVIEQSTRWGITPQDWIRYRDLITGPRGFFSPDADPISILGASAITDAERKRFADIYVRMAYERTEGDLAFTRAVSQAWQRSFPNQTAVRLAPMRRNTQPGDGRTVLGAFASVQRVALVVETDCKVCAQTLKQYLGVVRRTGTPNATPFALDIFLRDSGNSDQTLREWVTRNKIPVSLIRSKRVTVNHGQQYVSGSVPQVWELRANGDWTQKRLTQQNQR